MKSLLILSGKGGTGKTTTAGAFLHFSKARAMADCDVDAPNLHLIAGQKETPETKPFLGGDKAAIDPASCIACGKCQSHCRFGAIHEKDGRYVIDPIACEGCGVCAWICPENAIALAPDTAGEQQLFKGERVFSTARLKMGRGNSGKLVSAVKSDLYRNAPPCELAIIDGSPGIGCPVIASVSGVDLVLVVAEPSLSGRSDLERLVETAAAFQTPLAVCVNKWDASPENTAAIEAFCQEKGLPFLGKVPYDPAAAKAINEGRSIAETACPARDALYTVYERAMEEISK